MFPVFDYTTILDIIQRGLIYVVGALFALSFGKMIITAILTPFCGKIGASMITTVVFFGAVMLLGQYALAAVQSQTGGMIAALTGQITQPFQIISDALRSTPPF